MNHPYCAEYKHVRIRPLHEADIELLRVWRNDPAISTFLRPIPYITPSMQHTWFSTYLQDSSAITFAIEEIAELHRVVGSLSIYNLSGTDSAEIGKIVVGDMDARGKQIGYLSLVLALQIGFQFLGLHKFTLSVHERNIPAMHIYQKAGFQTVGSHNFINGGKELEMHLTKAGFEDSNPMLSEVNLFTCESK